jgi:hypothetical protein
MEEEIDKDNLAILLNRDKKGCEKKMDNSLWRKDIIFFFIRNCPSTFHILFYLYSKVSFKLSHIGSTARNSP